MGWPPEAYLLFICSVSVPNAAAPAELKLRLVCQYTLDVFWVALADLMSLPSTVALSRTNLYATPPSEPHETVWMLGLLYCWAV